jgi:hypothetical protein
MSFHEDELLKIKKSISGFFRGSARQAVSLALVNTKTRIDDVKRLEPSMRRDALDVLLQEAKDMRQRAVAGGASSYSDPRWAAAAATESWLAVLVQNEDGQIDDASRARVEQIATQLIG